MSSREPVPAFVALGANLGDPVAALARATAAVARLPQTRLVACSSLYLSAPVDAGGPDYFNAVIEISTALTAPHLLQLLQKIEQEAGRERPWPNAPRTLDLDLLLFGHASLDGPHLTVPHPRMLQRAFVLLPLAEIAPSWAQAAQAPGMAEQRIERIADPRWMPALAKPN